eukprot:6205967-Pyramimonas_sp.AAC.1
MGHLPAGELARPQCDDGFHQIGFGLKCLGWSWFCGKWSSTQIEFKGSVYVGFGSAVGSSSVSS